MKTDRELINEVLAFKGFSKMNSVQKEVVKDGLLKKGNRFIVAPTSNGKTLLAEFKIRKALEDGMKVLFLVPLKTLIDKTKEDLDWINKLGYKVGDVEPNDAWNTLDVMITTYDGFYINLLKNKTLAQMFSLVILDEIHNIYDNIMYEKIISILSTKDYELLALTATLGGLEHFKSWLNAKINFYGSEYRKIKLEKIKVNKEEVIDFLTNTQENGLTLVANAKKDYCTSRAREIAKHFTSEDLTAVKEALEKELDRTLTNDEEELAEFISKGIGVHNSVVDPKIKKYIENLAAKKKLNLIYATTSLGQGVNFPFETSFMHDLTWYDFLSGGSVPIPNYVLEQFAGRSGRVGLSKKAKVGYISGGKVYIDGKLEDPVDKYLVDNPVFEEYTSIMGRDNYFKKFLLELISAGYTTDQELKKIFEHTYYNHENQVSHNTKYVKNQFDLDRILGYYLNQLLNKDYITNLGKQGFKLTSFAEKVINFLLKNMNMRDQALENFEQLKSFAQTSFKIYDEKSLFLFFYKIVTFFPSIKLYKRSRSKEFAIEEYLKNRGLKGDHIGYTVYALLNGWLNEKDIVDISEDYKVYAQHLPHFIKQFMDILDLYEEFCTDESVLNEGYYNIKKELRYGVHQSSLIFFENSKLSRTRFIKLKHHIEDQPLYHEKIKTNKNITIYQFIKYLLDEAGVKATYDNLIGAKGFGEKSTLIIINKMLDTNYKSEGELKNIKKVNSTLPPLPGSTTT